MQLVVGIKKVQEHCKFQEVKIMAFERFSHLGRWHTAPAIEDIRGFEVVDSAGKLIGIVDDLLLSTTENDTTNYVLIGQGNVATMLSGKELIAPAEMLKIDSDSKSVMLDVNIDQLWDFPTYSSLGEPDLKDKVDSFWADTLVHPFPFEHDVTVRHPASLESPVPVPHEVEPSKMPAHNPRVVAGLESPISEEVINRAVEKAEGREKKEGKEPAA